MCPRYKRKSVIMIERFTDVLSKRVTRTTRRDAPPTSIVRIRPKQVAHWPFVRHLLHSVDTPDMIKRIDGGRETSVQTEYLDQV